MKSWEISRRFLGSVVFLLSWQQSAGFSAVSALTIYSTTAASPKRVRTILYGVAPAADSRQLDQGESQESQSSSPSATTTSTVPSIVRTPCITGVAPQSGPLNQAVAAVARLDSLQQANDLIEWGAVWARMEALTEQDLLELYDDDSDMSSSSRALYADLRNHENQDQGDNGGPIMDLEEYVQQMQQQRFRRVLSPSWIEAGTDLRIYPQPRRFPTCYDLQPQHLLYQDTTFLVVDKPPMLPTQPDASNYYECLPGCVSSQLGPFTDITGRTIDRPLLCHRVDACVGGCVVMSKDRKGQSVFQDLQRQRAVRKVYKALTTSPVPVGMHIHWMWAPQAARGKSGGPPCQLVSHVPPESRRKARQFWNRCVLEVTQCEPIAVEADPSKHTYIPEPGVQHYQSTIRLVTGRKHQVRAQLASLGCPIVRDSLYQPMASLTLDGLETGEDDLDAAVAKCRVPTEPIGLQASAILFAGIRAKASAPWWAVQ